MVFFSFFDDKWLGKKNAFLLSVTLLFVASFTTIFERQHTKLMQEQGFDQIAVSMNLVQMQFGSDIALSSYSSTPAMAAFYQQRLGLEDRVQRFSKRSGMQDFGVWLSHQHQEFLGFGWTDFAPVEWEMLSAWFYPYELQHQAWFNANWFVRAKLKQSTPLSTNSLLDVENEVKAMGNAFDTLYFDSDRVYGPALNWDSEKLDTRVDMFGVGAHVLKSAPISELRLVVEIREKNSDSLLYWHAGTAATNWQTDGELILLAGFRLSNIGLRPKNISLKAYLWNKGGEKFELVDMFSYQRRQYPYELGLVEPF
jgi:hypothetical protein